MRRLWAIPVLALMLAALCIFPARTVRVHTAQLDAALETCVQQIRAEDYDAAAMRVTEAQADFARWQPRACAFLYHSELDPLQEALAEAAAGAEMGEWNDCLAACRRAQTQVRHLADTARVSWGNLL